MKQRIGKVQKRTRESIQLGYRVAHFHIAKKPHHFFTRKLSWYGKWHNHKWHKPTHVAVASTYLLGVFVYASTVVFQSGALSTWTQSNWDGGVGSSTSDQYSAASNIDTSVENQLTLEKGSNSFSNSTFDSNITGWNGFANSYDSTQSYSASASAKITAPSVSSQHYPQTTIYNSASTYPSAQDAGDINADGREDLVIGHYGNNTANVSYALASSDGTLGSFTTLNAVANTVMDVRTADLNNDGYSDIVVSYWSAQYISVFLNNGSGGFTTYTNYTVLTGSGGIRQCGIELGKLNNDAYLDIGVTCSGLAFLYTFTNTGSGTFNGTASSLALTNAPAALNIGLRPAFGDLNGDGVDEVAIQAWATCNFDYFTNDGSGVLTKQNVTLTTCGTSGVQNYSIDVFDIDNDNKEDILIPRYSGTGGTGNATNYLTVFKGTSGGIGSQADTSESSTGIGAAQRLDHTDVNGDGYLDFALTSGTGNALRVFINDGDSTFTTQSDLVGTSTLRGFTFIDVDGNGKKDIAAGLFNNATTNTVYLLFNKSEGGTLTQTINTGNTNIYQLESYVYKAGGAITSTEAQLFANGRAISTTYTSTSTPGWYLLQGKVTGANAKRGYGVIAKQGHTIYVDNISLFEYDSSGTLTSSIFDPSFGGDWGSITFDTTIADATEMRVRTSDDANMTGAPDFSTCDPIGDSDDISANNCVTDSERYVQYQITLNRDDGDTPVFTNFELNYDAFDIIPPEVNASSLSMYKVNGGDALSSNDWTNGASPYFTWDAAVDNTGGSGIFGYCLYLGQDDSQVPETSKGMLGTSPVESEECPFVVASTNLDLATSGMLGSALTTSNDPYFISIKALDIAGNVFDGSSLQFQFRFDNTPPQNPAYVSAPSSYLNTKAATLTWPSSGADAAQDAHSGLAGLQYRINSNSWYGDDHTGLGDINDLLDNDGTYTTTSPDDPDETDIDEGINLFYMRTWDQAGNISSGTISAALKINTSSAPSAPNGVTADPITNDTNDFSFSWSPPSSYTGTANSLTYCYTINVLPSNSSCTYTTAGVTELDADAYATQPGENTFYVVAKDEAGNINYSNRGEVSFYADTPAPGVVTNMDVLDASVKTTSNWRLAVTWDPPSYTGAGISSYRIYRSTDNVNFNLIGSSTSTSYVDAGLSQVTYYYRVRACDSANQCSANSSIVSELPTGKFTEPAVLSSQPEVSDITTKRATIKWATDRESDSKVSIGTQSGVYSQSEVGNSSQVTDHELELDNLAAGTTYYLVAKWTDEDGNTGTSQEFTFTTSPAPLLKEVETQKVNLTGATIRFTTKSATKAIIYYGKSESFGGAEEVNTSLSESTYSVALEGLDDGAKYLFKIGLFDSEGTEYQSSIFSFETPPRPRISNLKFQPVENEPTSTQKITWTTNVPTTSGLTYGQVGTNGTDVQNNELKTEHSITIRNLIDDSDYFLIAEGRDADGNLATSDEQQFKTALDTRPPEVSDIVIETSIRGSGPEARGQIIVSWKTDEPATSQLAYAEGSNAQSFNNRTAEDGELTTDHLVIISDLQTSKAYTIRPVSKDDAGNTSEGENTPAIIGRASDSVLNIVLDTLRRIFGF